MHVLQCDFTHQRCICGLVIRSKATGNPLQPITLETATLCCVIQAASSHSAYTIVQGPSEENISSIT